MDYFTNYVDILHRFMEETDKGSSRREVLMLLTDLRDETADLIKGYDASMLVTSAIQIVIDKMNRRITLLNKYIEEYEKLDV